MAGDAVAEVKSRLDLVEVIGGYVTLHRAGRELTGLCPVPRREDAVFHGQPGAPGLVLPRLSRGR